MNGSSIQMGAHAMKKIFLAVMVSLAAWASAAFGGIGVNWTAGGRVFNNDYGEGVAAHSEVVWQLVYAGENGVADDVDLTRPGWVGGDDVVLAERWIPEGGGMASDGTEWTVFLEKVGGDSVFEDVAWTAEGYVFQRIYRGAPDLFGMTELFQSPLHAILVFYSGGTFFPDVFCAADGVEEGVVCTIWWMPPLLDMSIPAPEGNATEMDHANGTVRRPCPENGNTDADCKRTYGALGGDAALPAVPDEKGE